MTAFTRIVIVLSMLRHAIGMPETPPNTVLVGLALFLTLFTMAPVLDQRERRGASSPTWQARCVAKAQSTAAWCRCATSWCARRASRTWR